jgi:hypothetical protein
VQVGFEVSIASLRKGRQDCCWQECTESGELQHFESCWKVEHIERAKRSLKESERLSSGGIVPLRMQRSRPWKDLNRKALKWRRSSKRRNQRQGCAEESREIPLTVRSEGSCEGVNSQAHERTGHRISAFGVWRGEVQTR